MSQEISMGWERLVKPALGPSNKMVCKSHGMIDKEFLLIQGAGTEPVCPRCIGEEPLLKLVGAQVVEPNASGKPSV